LRLSAGRRRHVVTTPRVMLRALADEWATRARRPDDDERRARTQERVEPQPTNRRVAGGAAARR